ncbi:MAG: formate acetyltransferase [Candidatus Bathyarchaeota archaeon]|nr:MAG: formate acetyltransferase [Candidatus Bathyarchaeota archaeon]
MEGGKTINSSKELTYKQRLELLHATKLEYARRKVELTGPRDSDEQGNVPLPQELSELVEAVSGSGVVVKTMLLKGFEPISNHPSGGFFGPRAVGENFRRLLEVHPTYIDPVSSMAGVYMVSFNSYRKPSWNFDYDYSHLHEEQERYGIDPGIGGLQHFCPDLKIGLDLGWGGLLDKVRRYREANPQAPDFYDGLEEIILGMQGWIMRHADDARAMAEEEERPQLRENLEAIADICCRLATDPPGTFREACQWLVIFQAAAKMYNGSGEWGQLDELLRPYYERDAEVGELTDDEAIFHLACLLLSETAYIQLGGPDSEGNDLTSRVSYLILEAVHRLKTPANIGVRVGSNVDPGLFRRGVEILVEDRMGFPKFVGDEAVIKGFVRSGYPVEDARMRVYSGCHWLAIPGREYNMMDLIKIDLAKVFDTALRDMMADPAAAPSIPELWTLFEGHLRRAVEVTAEGIDLHLEHMHRVFPELYLDLFCYGPLEKGLDASQVGAVDYHDIGLDGASLATVADSFAALEQRVEEERRLTWWELMAYLGSDWAGIDGERARLMMRNIPRFGVGGSRADEWAVRIASTFTSLVTEKPTPNGVPMVPGFFSWAKVVTYGKRLGATPDGRRAGEPVSHGPNPSPTFNMGKGGTPTQMVTAVAAVQPGRGNTAPLQLDIDPSLGREEEAVQTVEALIKSHFDMGGTLVNINVLDRETLLDAQRDPSRYPDLMVRVTGFSAYFASLSDELRQYVVGRIVTGG